MENLNSAEKISKGIELVGEGVLETFQNAINLFVMLFLILLIVLI